MDISTWVERNAGFYPDKTAIRFAGQDISYAMFHQRIRRLAAMLERTFGVARGDRVAYLGYNSPEMLDLFFACAHLGAMIVPLNWRLAAPELEYMLKDCTPRALFAEEAFRPAIDGFKDGIGTCRWVGYGGGEGWEDYDALLKAVSDAPPAPSPDPDDGVTRLLIVYTSGTTGRPKGAVLSQEAVTWNAVNASHQYDIASTDIVLNFLPMFHVGGLNVQTTPAFHSGATVVLHAVFDPAAALASIARDRPTLFVNVPATMQAIRAQPDFDKTDFSSVRMMSTGSTTVPLPIVKAYQDKGVRVGQVYGLTETAPLAVVSLGIEGPDKFGSTGKAALHCEARIVDDEGNDLPPGEAGEILIKGPNVMTEYWNNPEATAAALRDGWLHTGDVARCDEDGYYWIVDRKKDVIISGSENIYPAELEGVLAECTELSEWAVVGRPDDKWGEVPIAAVVRAPGSTIDDTGVLALFENTLARYKHPRGVVFLDALPRNAMGKILKQEVRELVKE